MNRAYYNIHRVCFTAFIGHKAILQRTAYKYTGPITLVQKPFEK
jgi:hypothetical protein